MLAIAAVGAGAAAAGVVVSGVRVVVARVGAVDAATPEAAWRAVGRTGAEARAGDGLVVARAVVVRWAAVARVAFELVLAAVSLAVSVTVGAVLVSGAAASGAKGSTVVVTVGAGLDSVTGCTEAGASWAAAGVVKIAMAAAIAVEARRNCEWL